MIDVLESPGGTRGTSFPSSRFFGGSKTARIHIDANGNLTNDGNGKVYGYDAANRLISVTQGSTVTGFVYDGNNRRVQETSNGTVVKQWVWCLGDTQPCEERDGSNNVTKRFYGQGEQIGGTNYYFTLDHLSSVREMTDASGNLVARYDYDPYGRRTVASGTDLADFGFTEFYHDQATNLDFSKARPLIVDLGRWLSRDPIGEKGGINVYAYVGNDPINLSDPLGLFAPPLARKGQNWVPLENSIDRSVPTPFFYTATGGSQNGLTGELIGTYDINGSSVITVGGPGFENPKSEQESDLLFGREWTTPWGCPTQPGQDITIGGGSIPFPIEADPALRLDGGAFFNAQANEGGVYFGGSTGIFGIGIGLQWGGK